MFMWTLLLWTHHYQKIETRGDKDCCRPVRLHEDIHSLRQTYHIELTPRQQDYRRRHDGVVH